MKEPTKADLAAAVTKLTQENAGMRELLAAISLAADVPVSKGGGYADEWKRSTRVLAVIKHAADIDGSWDGYLAWAAGEVRSLAAEPAGYEVYVKPEDDELHAEPVPETVPWPTGLCGHTVTPGAWSHGFTRCRDCLVGTTPDSVSWYDRATAGEQLDRAAS